MFTTMHWLPNRRAAARTNSGSRTAAELIDTLSQPASSSCANVVERANAAADGQRHEHLLGGSPHDVEHDVAAFVAGGDVEKHQFVGAFRLVPRGHLDRIAGIAQVQEIGSLDHATAVDIEAGNDAFGEHGGEVPRKAIRHSGTTRREKWPKSPEVP